MNDDWQHRVDAQWQRLDVMPPEAFVAAIDALAAECPDDPAALFERGAARDSTGIEDAAETFYRAALASGGLDPYRAIRARLQLASTLRILGRLDESEALLLDEMKRREATSDAMELHDELRAILALTWIAQGRAVEAAALLLKTLAPHLTRYRRSMEGQADRLSAMHRAC